MEIIEVNIVIVIFTSSQDNITKNPPVYQLK
jgi:hypothetical protein